MVTDGLSVSRLAVVDRQTSIRFVRARPYSGISVEARPTGRQTQLPRDQFDSARSQRSSVLVSRVCVCRVASRSINRVSIVSSARVVVTFRQLPRFLERERGRRRRPIRETGEPRIGEERNGARRNYRFEHRVCAARPKAKIPVRLVSSRSPTSL